ncbi:hypothetical protein RRG08_040383 [Elysia crispata]|uniref:Uncharacterized protein n=1 Tax=Elysia crispata TaxID=231223 RepID=A0AAE1A1U7_9GAST|nr:hypothetical protein RRG08_040383 [Elysia crispata]
MRVTYRGIIYVKKLASSHPWFTDQRCANKSISWQAANELCCVHQLSQLKQKLTDTGASLGKIPQPAYQFQYKYLTFENTKYLKEPLKPCARLPPNPVSFQTRVMKA